MTMSTIQVQKQPHASSEILLSDSHDHALARSWRPIVCSPQASVASSKDTVAPSAESTAAADLEVVQEVSLQTCPCCLSCLLCRKWTYGYSTFECNSVSQQELVFERNSQNPVFQCCMLAHDSSCDWEV